MLGINIDGRTIVNVVDYFTIKRDWKEGVMLFYVHKLSSKRKNS